MYQKIIARLLHIANSDPPFSRKNEFYIIKDAILKKNGVMVGHQVQHIEKPCWSCDGTGICRGYDNGMYWVEFDPPRKCYRCKGGVYDGFWVLLELYEFGEYKFHRPVKRTRDLNSLSEHCMGHLFGSMPMIEGYVEHKKYRHGLMREAAYWLFLFYNPKAYFGLIGKTSHRRSWYPLGFLLRFTFWAKHDLVDWFKKISRLLTTRPVQRVDDDIPF